MGRHVAVLATLATIALSPHGLPQSPLAKDIDRLAAAVEPELLVWRRHLHEHPELSNREVETAKYIAERLRSFGLEPQTGIGRHGVVALLKGARPGPVVALRADMDALPVREEVDLPFASKATSEFEGQKVGVMHACGHDAHMAIGLAAAKVLGSLKDRLPGSVKFIFQPAEEGTPSNERPAGAELMVKEGVLENPHVDAVFGLHVFANVEAGHIQTRPGPMLAGSDLFEIIVRGRQTHGAAPWAGIDPIVVGSQIVTALQTIVSRQVDITRLPAIVTVGQFNAGVRSNIIPDSARMTGTIRTFDDRIQADIHERVRRTAESIAASAGATAEVKIERQYPVTANHPELTARVRPTLERVAPGAVGESALITGAEDFTFYQRQTPGVFVILGVTPKEQVGKAAQNHSPRFFVEERALVTGVRTLAHLAADYLFVGAGLKTGPSEHGKSLEGPLVRPAQERSLEGPTQERSLKGPTQERSSEGPVFRPARGTSVDPSRSRAEQSNYEETSRYDDVQAFLQALREQPGLHVESFGKSEEGRDLQLAVIGPPTPDRARASSRPVVFVMANIHAGEVEGKEAALHLARRLVSGDLKPLAEKITVLLAPNYNADGNERVSLENRTQQNGPVGGVGTRENAKGLDLNRDYMKLESAEARALVALMNRWDPHIVVDLHTTNGSYHGYHLTYAPTLNPNASGRLIDYSRKTLLPAIQRAVAERHKFRTYYYGNFATTGDLRRELLQFGSDQDASARVWRTFDHRPRFGNNYVGLRNRIPILSEAYSYLDFRGRVAATEAYVEEILRFTAEHGREITALTSSIDAEWQKGSTQAQLGVAFEMRPLPAPVEILKGAVEKRTNPRSGKEMIAMRDEVARPIRMLDYGLFVATRRAAVPDAYAIPASAGALVEVVGRSLAAHGIEVNVTTSDASVDAGQFAVAATRQSERPFQGHRERTVDGSYARAKVPLPRGTLVIRTRQRLGRLVFYLLDPESDDGLGTWNVLDTAIAAGQPHPVLKLADTTRLPVTRWQPGSSASMVRHSVSSEK